MPSLRDFQVRIAAVSTDISSLRDAVFEQSVKICFFCVISVPLGIRDWGLGIRGINKLNMPITHWSFLKLEQNQFA
jgi:hypothetical protein